LLANRYLRGINRQLRSKFWDWRRCLWK